MYSPDARSVFSAQIAALERELEEHEQRGTRLKACLRDLRERQNDLRWVNTLPSEILCRVFEIHKAYVVHEYGAVRDTGRRGHLKWTKITHVCRRWRNIALAIPVLWADIDNLYPFHALQTFIERSKAVPFALHYSGPKDLSSDAIWRNILTDEILPLDRLKSLDICVGSSADPRWIFDSMKPTSSLESLRLYSTTSWPGRTLTATFLPPHILQGATRQLRELRLLECKLSWSFPLLEGLTTFHLEEPKSQPGPSHGELVQALRNMPNVVDLSLKIKFPDSPQPKPLEIVKLPSLRQIKVDGKMKGVGIFLAHLDVPRLSTIEIDCGVYEVDDYGLPELTSGLAHISHTELIVQFSQLEVTLRNIEREENVIFAAIIVTTPSTLSPIVAPQSDPDPDSKGETVLRIRLTGAPHVLSDICDIAISLPHQLHQHTRSLSMCLENSVNSDAQLHALLCAFNTLEELQLTEFTSSQSIAWLAQDPALELDPDGDTLSAPQIRLPALKTLNLEQTNFGGPVCAYFDGAEVFFEVLTSTLLARQLKGIPLQVLLLNECGFLPENLVRGLEARLPDTSVLYVPGDDTLLVEDECCGEGDCPRYAAFLAG